jgi:Putative prokaryotic signal transducing protein
MQVSVPDMHTIYRAENLFDAHLVKDALEAEGIPAFIAGEYLTGAVGQLPAMNYIAVMVPESSLAIASGIVHQVEAQLTEARAAIDDIGELPDGPMVVPC